ncbi:hypothetical protein [Prevotella corporis]|jgi:hypothetical protein|uniref:hypothetical protein n=1 Tax=Prevotella corporis TaxID=28128 RepID=UPI0023F2418D|nr:hypothetical protein [Prevotella corporis]
MNKILRYAFVVALAAVSTLTYAQTKTVTFSAASGDKTSAKEVHTLTKDGVTLTLSEEASSENGPGDMSNKYAYRIYKNCKFTISSAESNILKIEMVCDNYQGKYLADGFSALEGLTIATDKINATWEGDANSVTFKAATHQVRVKNLTVTLKDKEPAGIETVETISVNENAPMYNLAGQLVNKNFKGVVIQNGKKFINK